MVAGFQAEGLELSETWAQTWPGWSCPCCERRKTEIARVTESGVLLCQLVWHHDHLGDAGGEALRAIALDGADSEEKLSARKRACAEALPLLRRFEEILVCTDCNAADGAMKALLGPSIPRDFSFSPQEIARFIRPSANSSHKLDGNAGRSIAPAAVADYEDRLAFARLMGERIAQGRHDKSVLFRSDPARGIEDPDILFRLASDAGGARANPGGLAAALLARSRSSATPPPAATRRQGPVAVPTPQDFELFDAEKIRGSPPWARVGTGWRCPGCRRTKFETLRKSNKGAWTAAVMEVHDYVPETNAESRYRRSRRRQCAHIFADSRAVGICQDCRAIITTAKTALPGHGEDSIRVSDLPALILEAKPHASHRVDKARILAVAAGNREWREAARDFWTHRDEVANVYGLRLVLMANQRLTAQAARDRLLGDLVAKEVLPPIDAAAAFDWMIAERHRLHGD